MFPDVLLELKSYFGRDFLLGVFFPTLIFAGANVTLYAEVIQGLTPTVAVWEKLSLLSQVLLLLGGLVLTIVLSYLIYNFQYNITRLFEGYWPHIGILQKLRNLRIKLYKRRWDYLDACIQSTSSSDDVKNELQAEQLTHYPLGGLRMMPTRIGNILRASELYAYDRYGIDSVVIWPRLRPLLSDSVVAPMEASRTARDFMLLMSLFAATFTLFWCPVLAICTSRWDLLLLCSLGWPLAWVYYQNAVQSALTYSEQLKAVFDLHRYDLLKALNRSLPVDSEAEPKEWKTLSEFFYRNIGELLTQSPQDKPWDQAATALAEYLKKQTSPTR